MKGCVLITGISGMIGGKLAEYMMGMQEFQQNELEIIGISRDVKRAKNVLGEISEKVHLLEGDVTDACFMEQIEKVDYIIHCAAVTESKKMVTAPVEVADGIVLGTRNILEVARRCKVKSMVYLSSMEVYGVVEDNGRARAEDELGSLDLKASRSSYPMAKRMAEHYCHIYYSEYGVPVKIARLAQVFGKGVRLSDQRVYMQFARSVVEGRDIVLKTTGGSMGNYCGMEDAVRAIMLILESGEAGDAYNVVNEANTTTILGMAEMVAEKIAEGRIRVRVEAEDIVKTGYSPTTGLRLSAEKLSTLGWKPTTSLEQMYRDVIETLMVES